jgi:hypothetical protein
VQVNGHGEKIGRKDDEAIAALLLEPSLDAAAARVGVAPATLARWLRLPSFARKYRAARRAVVESAVARLQQASGEAVACLRRNLSCGRPSVEVRAAEAILDAAVRGVELMDQETRLAAVERQLKESGKAGGEGTCGADD